MNGYDTDTVGEDMELVLRLQDCGIRQSQNAIVYEPKAVCYTGAPHTLKRLMHQRDRWQRGLLDCLIKHFYMIANPLYGFLGLVTIPWQFILELLGPVWAFLYFVLPLFRNLFPQSWLLYLVYVGVELGVTLLASFLDAERLLRRFIKQVPMLLWLTVVGILIQFLIAGARIWGMISFPWRRLEW